MKKNKKFKEDKKKRKKHKNIKRITGASLLVFFFLISKFFLPDIIDTKISTSTYVSYVYDGDTVMLKNGEKVRLIGVDTPEEHESDKLFRVARQKRMPVTEIMEQGRIAHRFTEDLVLNKDVIIKLDEKNEYCSHRDKYERLLAYIYIPDEGLKGDNLVWEEVKPGKKAVFLNASIVKSGFGEVYRSFPYSHKKWFLELEQEARENKVGLWK